MKRFVLLIVFCPIVVLSSGCLFAGAFHDGMSFGYNFRETGYYYGSAKPILFGADTLSLTFDKGWWAAYLTEDQGEDETAFAELTMGPGFSPGIGISYGDFFILDPLFYGFLGVGVSVTVVELIAVPFSYFAGIISGSVAWLFKGEEDPGEEREKTENVKTSE